MIDDKKSSFARVLKEAPLLEEELQTKLKEHPGKIIILEDTLKNMNDPWRNPYFKRGYLKLDEERRRKEREFLQEISPDFFKQIMEEKKKYLPEVIKKNEKRLARGLPEIDPCEVSLTNEQKKAFNVACQDLGKGLELKCSFNLYAIKEGSNTTYSFSGGIWPFFEYYFSCDSYGGESRDIPEFVKKTIKALNRLKKNQGVWGAEVTPVFFTSLEKKVQVFPGMDKEGRKSLKEERSRRFKEDVKRGFVGAVFGYIQEYLLCKSFNTKPFTFTSMGLNEQERAEFEKLYAKK